MPSEDSVPMGGFSPAMPWVVAQATTENEVSVPMAAAQSPAEAATPLPELEPKGSKSGL